ncbi:MAG: ABC transporter ATP-binding protein [Paracoccaceae bacterium]
MSLSLNNINLSYGRNQVLFDVSVRDVKRGEFVGLIGPNASGKSTLFRAITGLIKPSAGSVVLDDTDLVGLRRGERARRVAYMPQAFGCNAALTVFESVLLALKQTTGWRVKAENLTRVEQVLTELSLTHIAGRGIGALSGGQAQMVAVAQTLVRDPALVLLDEPTSALDLHHQLSILTAIRNAIHSRDMIGIAALHDLNLAAQFCDRLILIRDGRIAADGLPKEVLALDEIGETYKVTTHLNHTSRGSLFVEAEL